MRRALSFLTPLGGARAAASPPGPDDLRWFPLVGAGLGLALGALWLVAARVWPPGVAAALVVAGDLALTGMLHLDGLIDSADGLLPPLPAERRLAAMADPATGAFGVGAGTGILLLRWAALASLAPSPLLLAGLWCLSRAAMAATVRLVPYARTSGLASAFTGPSLRPRRPLLALVPAVALAGLGLARGFPGLAAGVAALVAALGVVALARRRLGGFTGDVLGAAGMAAETLGLVVAAARW